MFKRAILLSIFLCIFWGLFSITLDWGVKYGAGFSSLNGKDLKYNLHYDITSIDTITADYGYLDMDSNNARAGISQNFGLYGSAKLFQKIHSISLQSELLWHRYTYSYNFKNKVPGTNNITLAAQFADTLSGSIFQTIDYVTIPVLVKLNQELPADYPDEHYNGAFMYFGPSFSFLINDENEQRKSIKALDSKINALVTDSFDDANTTQVLSSTKKTSSSDKIISHKIDFVFGLGFNLKDIFNLGLGKDEFTIDCRFDFGINPIGDADIREDIKLYSTILSIGCKL